MGERKATARRLAKALIEEGKPLKAEFLIFADSIIPREAEPGQRLDMELAFFAGAAYLFSSLMEVLDDEAEETAEHLRWVEIIHDELEVWRRTIAERVIVERSPHQGRA